VPQHTRAERPQRVRDLLRDHRLLVFAGGVALFQLGNAAVLPLAANALTRSSSQLADLVVPAVVIVPQVVAAALSPWVGRLAQRHGRRAVMLVGFAVLPLRITLFALDAAPVPIICYQMLDGVAAAMLGVMVPLVAADITRRGGRFNLAMGIVGLASGLGATLSNTVAGAVSNQFGVTTAYIGLAVPALAAVLLIWLRMPDTGRSRSPATTKARPA
jgi:MFS family permease